MVIGVQHGAPVIDGGVAPSRWLRVARAFTGALVIAYALSTILRPSRSSSAFFDGWVGNLGYGSCALLCVWRAVARRLQRWAWSAIALALVLFFLGNFFWTTVVQFWNPIPYPSISDVFFLLFYPVAYVGVGLLARDHVPRGSGGVWLDGMIAVCGVATIETVFVIERIAKVDTGNALTVATNLAYPIGDLVLLVMVVGLFAMRGWRPQPLWWTLGTGLVVFAGADTIYVLRVLSGTYITGTPLDSMWLIGTFLIANAAWQSPSSRPEDRVTPQPAIIPLAFTLTSLAIVFSDGQLFHISVFADLLATGTVMLAIARLARSYRQLRLLAVSQQQAVTDDLTNLGNRRLLRTRLAMLLAEPPRRTAMLIVDLDRFKEVNDAYGHPAGDELLAAVGARLTAALEPGDLIVRLGGDEFAVVLVDGSEAVATELGSKLTNALSQPFDAAGASVHITASIGVALAPDHATTPAELMRCADVALYQAKAHNGGWSLYSAAVDQSKDRLELIEDLRTAIADRALHLCYQPQVDLRTGNVRGVEALIRWPHPTRGMVPPDVFVPLAERARLMGPLTEFVLADALAQCAEWQRHGTSISVAVNLSTTNLLDEHLPNRIAEHLHDHCLAPAQLVVEITETTLMVDPEHARLVINELHSLGVGISVDDFGTGYSSMAYLRDLPVDELKLDRVFLDGIADNPAGRSAAIARSTLHLGHALGITVLAEGVEDAATLNLLRSWGYDAAQGYHLGRPVLPAELAFDQQASQTPEPV
jgi:diguanylate cyclase (GGDEF)-like protein